MRIELRVVYGLPGQTSPHVRWGWLRYGAGRPVLTSDLVSATIDDIEGRRRHLYPTSPWHTPHRLVVLIIHPATGVLLVLDPNKSWAEQGVVSSCAIYLVRPGACLHAPVA